MIKSLKNVSFLDDMPLTIPPPYFSSSRRNVNTRKVRDFSKLHDIRYHENGNVEQLLRTISSLASQEDISEPDYAYIVLNAFNSKDKSYILNFISPTPLRDIRAFELHKIILELFSKNPAKNLTLN